ncbi:MAG: hypothetical protein ACODAJ_16555, partial [Planctomycetota bacterium]
MRACNLGIRMLTVAAAACLLAAGATAAASVYEDAVLDDSPVAYWRLDDTGATTTADDAGPNNIDSTYTGGFTLEQGSLLPSGEGTSVAFDGTAQAELRVPDNGAINTSDSGYNNKTVELFFRADAIGTS